MSDSGDSYGEDGEDDSTTTDTRTGSKHRRRRPAGAGGSSRGSSDPEADEGSGEESGQQVQLGDARQGEGVESREASGGTAVEANEAVEAMEQKVEDALPDGETPDGSPATGGSGGGGGPVSGGTAPTDPATTSASGDPDGADGASGSPSESGGLGTTVTDADGRADLAQRLFVDDVVDETVGQGAEYRGQSPSDHPVPGIYGGFEEYSPDSIASRTPLTEASVPTGFTANSMEAVDLRGEAADRADTAFISNYGGGEDLDSGAVALDHGQLMGNQIAMYGFAQAIGLAGPEMAVDTSGEEAVAVVFEDVAPEQEAVELELLNQSRSDWAEKVDRDAFLDTMATHLLAGNWDLKPKNMQITEDGDVIVHDYDRMERSYYMANTVDDDALTVENTAARIDALRSDDKLDIDHDDVKERMAEIAHSIEESGQTDRVVSQVEEYVDLAQQAHLSDMSDARAPADNHTQIRRNIETLADEYDS